MNKEQLEWWIEDGLMS